MNKFDKKYDDRIKMITFILIVFILLPIKESKAQQFKKLANGTIIIDNFQEDTVGKLPYGWYNRDGNVKVWTLTGSDRDKYKYEIKEEDGNKYLHYHGMKAMHLNFPLVNKNGVDIMKTPILTWKWRVKKIPKGGDENDSDKNDSAAGIYVVYGFAGLFKLPKSIKYCWSSTLPVGTILSKNFNKQKIVVLASGKKNEGKWITFQRNIVQDYKNLFGGEPPKKPIAILVLSDGNNTHSMVEADYDDIELRPVDTRN
ncbi:MAG TPA: DUF3047 domain-containing protein [Balneolales bacterium]|nr:DUF3047 domain-containing protein [Balneolales bacterium]